jgi:hypothetical protein
MKKIIIILADGSTQLAGYATSLYEYLLAFEKKVIVPLHGHKDYSMVGNIYHPELDQFVTYMSI